MADSNSPLDSVLKVIGVVGTIGTFIWGIHVYQDTSAKELAKEASESARYAETRRIEATKPFLERQLQLYTEATQTAATIATSKEDKDSVTVAKARKRFLELYWGELALVEDAEVVNAMNNFKEVLDAPDDEARERLSPENLSIKLAHACRNSLANSWGVKDWHLNGKKPANNP